MNIVIIGGSGLIGAKLAARLEASGHRVVAASKRTGVDVLTGHGLYQAIRGAEVLVDVTNSPSFEDAAVMHFFDTATRNLIRAASEAKIAHYVALSVVGTDSLQQSGYFRAKLVQERQIEAAGLPYTIVRATQFYEFLGAIADAGTAGAEVRLPPSPMQPIAADDVAAALVDVVLGQPANGIVDVAGPEPLGTDEAVRRYLVAKQDLRSVVSDAHARYFGVDVGNGELVPAANARTLPTRLDDWLRDR